MSDMPAGIDYDRWTRLVNPAPREAFADRLDLDELEDFDPCAELGGQPCERCGAHQEPWRYSSLCQACIWDQAGAR